MKKIVLVFSVLALVFSSCKKEDKEDPKEEEISYAGSYAGQYTLADTTYDATVFFINGLLKDRLKLYGIMNFEPTDTTGFYRANIAGTDLTIATQLLTYIGVKTPENINNLVKSLNATAAFDGLGKVNMKLEFGVDVNLLGDTVNLNWQLVSFEGLRK